MSKECKDNLKGIRIGVLVEKKPLKPGEKSDAKIRFIDEEAHRRFIENITSALK